MLQISYPPRNGASLGSYLDFFGLFYFATPEIIGVEFRHRQTDRQTDRQRDRQTDRQTDRKTDRQIFDTVYGWVWIFFQSKFSTSLLASLVGG